MNIPGFDITIFEKYAELLKNEAAYKVALRKNSAFEIWLYETKSWENDLENKIKD